MVDVFMRVSGIYGQRPEFYFLPIYYSFAFGPLIYFYVKSITNSAFKLKWIHLLHFIPVILQAGLYLFLSTKDYSFKRWYWSDIHQPYTYRIEFDGSFVSLAIYSILSFLLLNKYQKWLDDKYSEHSKSQLKWLKVILMLMVALTAQWFAEVILRDFYANYYGYNYSSFILALLTLILAFLAFHQADQEEIKFQGDTAAKKDQLQEVDTEILAQIEQRMTVSKDYLNPTLSLKTFAGNCKLPQKVVSQYLNQELNKTFHTFVNDYRIEAFQDRVKNGEHLEMTLEGLAYECGFNSKASFNRIFKKKTGQTPSQFAQA